MDDKRAREILEDYIDNITHVGPVTEAIRFMLEQEPKTVVAENATSDCISREQAIKCLECDFDITGRANMEIVVNYINSAHDKIMNLPSVKQEPKQGHWIMHLDDLFPMESTMECSECGEHQPLNIDDNYCPNCGCRMEKVSE